MKAYNLKTFNKKIGEYEITAILLGEEGRGRRLTTIPCPEGIKDGEFVSIGTTRTGRPRVNRGGEKNGWLAVISPYDGYRRNACGEATFPEDCQLIATGEGAFGEAGRVGGWTEYLVVVPDNTPVKVKTTRGEIIFYIFNEYSVDVIKKDDIADYMDIVYKKLAEKIESLL